MAKRRNKLSGKELFNDGNWYKLNRLMVFYTSDEESVMFSLLCDVENRWRRKNIIFFEQLGGRFLLTVDYVHKYLNKDAKQQRRALRKLEARGLISIKYWAGKKRTIKIEWDTFTETYLDWLNDYNNKERKIGKDPFENMVSQEESYKEKFREIEL